jgi:hypothetical protein
MTELDILPHYGFYSKRRKAIFLYSTSAPGLEERVTYVLSEAIMHSVVFDRDLYHMLLFRLELGAAESLVMSLT